MTLAPDPPGDLPPIAIEVEQLPWLALLPPLATAIVWSLPAPIVEQPWILFAPQLIAYVALIGWAHYNRHPFRRLGLDRPKWREGWRTGLLVGLALGLVNSWVILWLVPHLGHDITFLRETPHAKIPPWIMVPWFIGLIALFVEVNFRGFVLGRLLQLTRGGAPANAPVWGGGLALLVSSLLFAFDPFLVATFQHLHWIAVWDGCIWGALWIRHRNLVMPIVAHAVEVIILYSIVRTWLAE